MNVTTRLEVQERPCFNQKKMLVVCWDPNIYQLNLFFFKTKAIM